MAPRLNWAPSTNPTVHTNKTPSNSIHAAPNWAASLRTKLKVGLEINKIFTSVVSDQNVHSDFPLSHQHNSRKRLSTLPLTGSNLHDYGHALTRVKCRHGERLFRAQWKAYRDSMWGEKAKKAPVYICIWWVKPLRHFSRCGTQQQAIAKKKQLLQLFQWRV